MEAEQQKSKNTNKKSEKREEKEEVEQEHKWLEEQLFESGRTFRSTSVSTQIV